MIYPEISYPKEKALELSKFREMDYHAVNNYNLPVELMMENPLSFTKKHRPLCG